MSSSASGLRRTYCEEHVIAGEVLVVDNGSTDGSGELARRAGARVVDEPLRGYGNAYPWPALHPLGASTSSWRTRT